MALVWWTTVKTVSAGGIEEFKWRSAISLFVIPMTYIGSFALAIVFMGAMLGNFGTSERNFYIGFGAFAGLIVGLLISNLIVIHAIKAVKPIEFNSEIVDAELVEAGNQD